TGFSIASSAAPAPGNCRRGRTAPTRGPRRPDGERRRSCRRPSSSFGDSPVIIETIVTTVSGGAHRTINCAPMGVEWGDDVIVLKPFLETSTYRNVVETGTAVVNLTDDVRVFARAA